MPLQTDHEDDDPTTEPPRTRWSLPRLDPADRPPDELIDEQRAAANARPKVSPQRAGARLGKPW